MDKDDFEEAVVPRGKKVVNPNVKPRAPKEKPKSTAGRGHRKRGPV